ncbi:hypothetical protein MKX01_042357 [Papaver californicum]|nr:hypothetical protein MKX01_042357 [Papaver californicum]
MPGEKKGKSWLEVEKIYGVVNVRRSHWVAVAICPGKSHIDVYDSMPPGETNKSQGLDKEVKTIEGYCNEVFNKGEWTTTFVRDKSICPRQEDG